MPVLRRWRKSSAPGRLCTGETALLGAVFILARAVYCAVYVRSPDKRSLIFGVGEIANTVLMVGAVIGAARSML